MVLILAKLGKNKNVSYYIKDVQSFNFYKQLFYIKKILIYCKIKIFYKNIKNDQILNKKKKIFDKKFLSKIDVTFID